ncbi:MAG: ABC transporter ATP-binding protein [Hydrogenophaga sp.]|uniref:ABC transporter ATP-binding protein n=1 Tax=Hydrogenophaga sp. TaxID=1904254 RepID=UPI004034FD18
MLYPNPHFASAAASGHNASDFALELDQVSVSFGERTVIDRMNFSVRAGEFLCLVGPSGCGKTTLLRLMAGLMTPTRGEVRFQGERISAPSLERAIVFQDYGRALLPWRTVSGNIALALEALRVPAAEREGKIDALLATTGLSQARERYPNQLSGGMQQRVQIARCLAQKPRLMLMDEPFGALDAITRQHLQDEVLKLTREHGTTVVFITHDLEEAIYLGDRVIVLGANPGRMLEEVEVGIAHPRHQLTTREDPRFLAHRHHLHGLLEGH